MTGYLLDTNVISELRKPKPHGGVVRWLSGLKEDQIFLSVVTLAELQRGIERTRWQDAAKARRIEQWVDQLEDSVNVLVMDGRCFREGARLMEGKPGQLLEDGMIAATARVNGLRVATRNEKDLALLDVETFNPFRTEP
ncbi:MAG: type II toxin-antitoxin system VapC family toxin [Acidobacteria bacterium]|nr:type II toxin-antitoxin system VapC family toxin [Acidobacteriota bacterium]